MRETLLLAALATRPTIELLLRAGRAEAEHDIRVAAAAGLLVTDGSVVRFTPPAVATVVAEAATAAHRSELSTPHSPQWSPTRSSGPGTGRWPRPTPTPRWPARS